MKSLEFSPRAADHQRDTVDHIEHQAPSQSPKSPSVSLRERRLKPPSIRFPPNSVTTVFNCRVRFGAFFNSVQTTEMGALLPIALSLGI
jgi:hypothetical protein